MSSEPTSLPAAVKDTVLSGKSFFSRTAGKIFLIWLVMTAIGVLIGIFAPSRLMPRMLSVEGHTTINTMILFTVLAAPVAAIVYAVAVYSLIAWRPKGSGASDEPPPDGPSIRGNTAVAITWLTTSSVLVVVLLIWGLAQFAAEETPHSNALRIDVTGQQWLWTFQYPGTGVQTRTLELPVNRPVEFDVTSVDVTHGFWIPAMGVQIDANPGETTVIRATPDKMGNFEIRCSQLCGLYHSFMFTHGSVTTATNFAKWLHANGASATSAHEEAS